jgi:hypothetical protein
VPHQGGRSLDLQDSQQRAFRFPSNTKAATPDPTKFGTVGGYSQVCLSTEDAMDLCYFPRAHLPGSRAKKHYKHRRRVDLRSEFLVLLNRVYSNVVYTLYSKLNRHGSKTEILLIECENLDLRCRAKDSCSLHFLNSRDPTPRTTNTTAFRSRPWHFDDLDSGIVSLCFPCCELPSSINEVGVSEHLKFLSRVSRILCLSMSSSSLGKSSKSSTLFIEFWISSRRSSSLYGKSTI